MYHLSFDLSLQQISREEFENGCAALNKNLPEEVQLVGIDKFYRVMDFDGGGSIDVNEFFEVWMDK
jgi:Ca2+-binding EF-hand superfamily protein